MAGFFPVFFKEYWSVGTPATESTLHLGIANSLASLMVVILAPVLGALADRSSLKKRLLALFAFLGVAMTLGLFLVEQGAWQLALILYGLGVIGFSGGNVFYDALLLAVTSRDRYDRVSAFGFSLGYLGGAILFACNVTMVLRPNWFGLPDSAAAVRYAFLTVGVWWAIFSVPILLFVPEPRRSAAQPLSGAVWGAVVELAHTFRELRRYRHAFLFLVAYWLYIDGVDTIVRMAVDYGLAIGFSSSDLLSALLLTQVVGFPAALVFGRVGERWGPKQGIWIAIAVYMGVVFWAWQLNETWEFYALAVVIGLVQGGIQALSRSLYARLIPPEHAGKFFGFYNMLGKFAAVLGPLMVGWVAASSADSRAGILSVLILFIAGAILLAMVDVREGEQAALASRGRPVAES